jgi:hypothetical protein
VGNTWENKDRHACGRVGVWACVPRAWTCHARVGVCGCVWVCEGVCHKRHERQPTQDMKRVTDKRHLDTGRAAEEERCFRRSLAPCPACSSGAPCVSPGTHRESWARGESEGRGKGGSVKEKGMEGGQRRDKRAAGDRLAGGGG